MAKNIEPGTIVRESVVIKGFSLKILYNCCNSFIHRKQK